MTGTAETEAKEFWDIYELDVVVVPTNKPVIRKDEHDWVFKTAREKYAAVIEEVEKFSYRVIDCFIGLITEIFLVTGVLILI